jgi:HAD superfamily hydrolase (TIGR01549 family)
MIDGIEAVIFDMDGTLFDSMDPVTNGFIETILAAGGPRYSAQEIIAAFARGWAGPMLTQLLGRPVSDGELADYHARLDASCAGLAPYGGTNEALDELHASGVRLGLFTGADRRSVEILLGRTSMQGRFEIATGGDEVRRAKPAPDGVVLTCRRLDVRPAAAAYVGDSPADMQAARAAGVRAIGAGWGRLWRKDIEADAIAAAPSDLLRLVGVA